MSSTRHRSDSRRLDAVVANAGFQHAAPVAEFPEEPWDVLVALLLASPFLLAKYACDARRVQRRPVPRRRVGAQARGLAVRPS